MKVKKGTPLFQRLFVWDNRGFLSRLPIKQVLIMLIMAVTFVGLLMAFSLASFFQLKEVRHNIIRQVLTLAKVLSDNAQAAVIFGNALDGQLVLSSLRNDSSVMRAFLYTQKGEALASYRADGVTHSDAPPFSGYAIEHSADFVSIFYPIEKDDETVGGLYLQASFDRVTQQLQQNVSIASWVMLAVLGGCFLIASKLHSVISRPILRLAQVSSKVSEEQDLSVRSDADDFLEIAILSRRFNEMLERLQRQEQALRTHGEELERCVEVRTRELQQSVHELNLARVDAEVANKSKDAFLSRMSHELRTPLNAVLGFANLMRKVSRASKKEDEYLQIICDSGQHLLGLINDVLDMSVLSSGKMCLELSDFELPVLFEGVCSMLKVKAEKKGLTLSQEVHNVPRYISGDERKIRAIVINLMNNAIKFTQQGSVTLRVITRDDGPTSEAEQRTLCIEVIDTGPGIAHDEQAELFSPFHQSATGRKNNEVGSGLGLSICQGFVEVLEGSLHVDSTLGMGTTFQVVLPITEVIDPQLPHPAKEVTGIKPGQREFRILVVEDHDYSKRMLVELLQSVGFTVYEASQGQEAIAQWRQHQPDLTWMDIQMPTMDGLEASKQIRAMDPEAIIILLTASVPFMTHKDYDMSACNDLLAKPFQEYDMFMMIARYLNIEYLYDETTPSDNAQVDVNMVTLTTEDLADLPRPTIEAIYHAAQKGSPEDIELLADALPLDHARVGNCLKELANQFLFSTILTVTSLSLHETKPVC